MALERRLRLIAPGRGTMEKETRVKVAFATGDMKHVDRHFGAAESFAVYVLYPHRWNLAEAVQFRPADMDGNEGKLGARIQSLDGCIAVYCQAVGGSAINQLRAEGIRAVKVSQGTLIKDLILSLQEELRRGPSPWLARAIEQQGPRGRGRFDEMEREGWLE